MIQQELFAKIHGQELAASAHEAELAMARDMAIKISALKGEVTIDDIRDNLPRV